MATDFTSRLWTRNSSAEAGDVGIRTTDSNSNNKILCEKLSPLKYHIMMCQIINIRIVLCGCKICSATFNGRRPALEGL